MPKLPPTWAEQQEQEQRAQQGDCEARHDLSQQGQGQHELQDDGLRAEPGEPGEAFEQQ